jgi:TolA-binding protein
LQEHPDYPLANEALLGIASSLDAQGKTSEAIARYDELINHHTADTTTPQAQVALARLYATDKKPEQAMIYYEKVLKSGMNDSWTEEAMMQYSELLEKNPGLKKPVPAPVLAPTMAPPANPAPNTTTSTPAGPVLSLPITNAPKK